MRRVLVSRLDSLGDVLLAGPAVRAVARDARVTMLCSRQGAPAARLLPGVDEVIEWDSPWVIAAAPPVLRDDIAGIVRRMRGFDELIVLTSFHQSPLPLALLARLAGVERITGASIDHAGSLLDVRLRPGESLAEDQPESERALRIVEAAGYRLPAEDDGGLAVRAEAPDPEAAPELPGAGAEGEYLVVHPGADAPARTWPAEAFTTLVERLTERGDRVLVTGGPGETALTARVAGERGHDLGGRLSLPALAGVLAGAAAVVVGNTGPAHLAAAVRTPVVSLFAPVVPAVRWAPHGVPRVLLGDQDAPCRNSRARLCPVPGHPCLSEVSPEDVVSAVDHLIGGTS